jgi:tRNA-specific 2-thiouridylase
MKILVAMSGGVDSSVAAALLVRDGHQVVGATMKLWGGPSDSGCCSVADVDDARRVAQQLGIAHHVFNFSDEFARHVVDPYVADHARGLTPNPCIECNRHLKFDRLLERAVALGFDSVATGHHARVEVLDGSRRALLRGVDQAKDQSYVLHMLGQPELARLLLPIGSLTKAEVREVAGSLGLRTATKPDSQDVCFVGSKHGRESFLGQRIAMRPAAVVDTGGLLVGELPAIELVTVGQRRGLGVLDASPKTSDEQPAREEGGGEPDGRPANVLDRRRYVVAVDHDTATITVGPLSALMVSEIPVRDMSWVDGAPDPGDNLEVQTSAHGIPIGGRWTAPASRVALDLPSRRVAPGQSVVLYRGEAVVGGGIAV